MMAGAGSMVGATGLLFSVDKPYILFQDGWAYKGFDVSPEALDPAASRQADPKKWTRWKRGATSYVTINDAGEELYKSYKFSKLQPVAPGELSGTFGVNTGAGSAGFGGNVYGSSVKSLVFSPDGRFSGGSATSVGAPNAGGGSSSAFNGTYKITGYTIELRYGDGRLERRALAWYDEEKKDSLYLGGSLWLRKRR